MDKEAARVKTELESVKKDLARSEGKLKNPQFTEKAPAAVVEKERRILAELTDKAARLEERLSVLQGK
mgnify:CR=1 FL=1